MLNLEELNNEYSRIKPAIEQNKGTLKKLEQKVKVIQEYKENAENRKKVATTKKEEETCQKEINQAITDLEKLKGLIEFEKSQIEKYQKDIATIIDEIRSNPEIMNQCNRAMEIKTERQMAKFEKQKKEQEEKKETLLELKSLIQKNPQLELIISDIENKSLHISKKESQIKDIEKEIEELDSNDSNYANDMYRLTQVKLATEKEIEGLTAGRQEDRNKIKKQINNPKYNEEIDNLTTKNNFDKKIKNCDRLIRRSENKVKDYTNAKKSLYLNQNIERDTEEQKGPSKWGNFKEDVKNVFAKKEPGDPSRFAKFKNTIKNLFSKKKMLPSPSTKPKIPQTSFKEEIKLDPNIMKYQVIQEIYQKDANQKFKNENAKRVQEENEKE